jgi:hypothetical protein
LPNIGGGAGDFAFGSFMSRNKIISNRLFPGDNGLSLKRSSVAALATTLAVHLLGKPAFCNARRAALAVKYWKGLKNKFMVRVIDMCFKG